jgi:hypothetical protein
MRNLYSVFNGLGVLSGPYLKAGATYYSVKNDNTLQYNTLQSAGTVDADKAIIVISTNSTQTNFKFNAVETASYWANNSDLVGISVPNTYVYPTKRYSVGDSVRIRSSASKSGSIVGVLNKGDSVYSSETTISDGTLNWRPVKYGSGKTGFVSSQYLSKNKPVGTAATTPEQTKGESKDPANPQGKDEGEVEVSFLDKYRTPLMLAGAALVIGGIAYYIYSNRDERSLAMAGAPKRRRRKKH